MWEWVVLCEFKRLPVEDFEPALRGRLTAIMAIHFAKFACAALPERHSAMCFIVMTHGADLGWCSIQANKNLNV